MVLRETTRVLDSAYNATKSDLLNALVSIRDEPVFTFEHPGRVARAIRRFASDKADFSDCLIFETAKEKGFTLKAFDRRLQKEH